MAINIPGITNIFGGGQAKPQPVQEQPFDPSELAPKETYFSWQSIGRSTHVAGNPRLTRSFLVIGVIVALFLVILQEYLLILVVASFIFVSQILSKTPPEMQRYELSSHGVSIGDEIYYWHQLQRFFFFNQNGVSSAAIDLKNGFPSRLFLSINEGDQEKIKEILKQKLHFLEAGAPETFLDRAYKSVSSQLKTQ